MKRTLCSGHCCENDIEEELSIKSTNNFYRMLRHHTRSLRNTLESTARTFRGTLRTVQLIATLLLKFKQ
ncbi:Division abnormally delayed protein [Pseudolycoriella hygida]|uniref:Division abnormally delayed protein n=1 Tax=Pseudolycoriella hygida TaxID=35572 RepID=A0A9Q0MZN9_9DIPT|nr:Division abnormally delayed protein [Pseudolycoriella hygida]